MKDRDGDDILAEERLTRECKDRSLHTQRRGWDGTGIIHRIKKMLSQCMRLVANGVFFIRLKSHCYTSPSFSLPSRIDMIWTTCLYMCTQSDGLLCVTDKVIILSSCQYLNNR